MRILCAVDGSECSRWGVQALEALAYREPKGDLGSVPESLLRHALRSVLIVRGARA
jgi:hypothetical protein